MDSVIYTEEIALAAVGNGEGGYLHIKVDGKVWRRHRNEYAIEYKILSSDMTTMHEADDIGVPVAVSSPDGPAVDALSTLVSFLLACAESKSEESENYNLFPTPIREWAELYSDELSMLALELEES